MSKYKYKLIEQEDGGEESGLKRLKSEKDLILTTKNDTTADDILAILKNPEYYKGVYTVKAGSSDIDEKQIFGDKATNPTQIKNNQKIYQENGIKLYKEIESATGKNFIKKDFTIKRDENGKILFAFPEKTTYHQGIVDEFLGGKKVLGIKKPEKVDQHTLKFLPSDRSDIEKVLSNAENKKVLSSKNYSMELIDKI